MLQRIACGSSPILLRCRVASIARTFSQSAAAVQEPAAAAAAADKNAAMREERISRMEAYVRKHWAEKGTLPKAYILTKEFGGAKSIAPKVLERLEPELKSGGAAAAAAEKSSSSPSPSPKLANSPGEVAGARFAAAATAAAQAPETATTPKASDRPAPTPTPSPPTSKPSDASSRPTPAQSKSDNSAEVKEPAINLWGKAHSITYSKPAPAADRPAQAAPPRPASPPRSSFAAQPAPKIRSGNSTEEDDSESESESGSDGDLAPGSEDKNPAQPLFRSDLQPRHGLYVKFLSPQATESDVRSAFRSCGEINRVQVVRSRNPAARYIYGFVDFKTEEGLNAALGKDILIRGVKVQTEPQKNGKEKEKEKQQKQPKQESESDEERSSKPKTAIAVSKTEDLSLPADKRRCTLALESIPHASLPHIIEALSQYGEVTNSQTKQSPGGNTTAYIEFKNEIEKDNALAASRVILGGKSLRMTRLDTPLTTVVRLSNFPSDERERIVSSYKSYGQVDKVEQRMDGVVDIYYNASEIKNMAKILDKLNGLQASRRKLRAVPAPISHPRSIAELAGTPEGQKWIESQLGIVRKNLALSLAKAAMYSRDLEQLLATTAPVPASNSIAAN